MPPPATFSVLHQAAGFTAQFPGATLLCMGDFNLLLDPSLDKFHDSPSTNPNQFSSALALLLEELGWQDLWRLSHPTTRAYSCHATGTHSLSRIDYLCSNSRACELLADVKYPPRAILDHSPPFAKFRFPNSMQTYSRWRINPF